MLSVNVRLFGTLSRTFEDYHHSCGLDIAIASRGDIHDLLVHLDLIGESIGMVFMDDKQVNNTTKLNDNARIKIFQPIFGG